MNDERVLSYHPEGSRSFVHETKTNDSNPHSNKNQKQKKLKESKKSGLEYLIVYPSQQL
jgi:hypothetical protein